MLRQQLEIFFAALRYFTRLPTPAWVGHSQTHLEAATRYFTLVGSLVGLAGYAVFAALALVFPHGVAVAAAMAAGVLLTGAFHEDGFADVCDGFGGGWERERILEIMKDSRVGAFGVLGVVLILLVKFQLLLALCQALSGWPLALAWAIAQSGSRMAAVGVMYLAPYARADQNSKAKPIAQAPKPREFWLALFWLLLLLALTRQANIWLLLLPITLVAGAAARYFKKWLAGYTGDCLGATQQVCEVALYASLLLLADR